MGLGQELCQNFRQLKVCQHLCPLSEAVTLHQVGATAERRCKAKARARSREIARAVRVEPITPAPRRSDLPRLCELRLSTDAGMAALQLACCAPALCRGRPGGPSQRSPEPPAVHVPLLTAIYCFVSFFSVPALVSGAKESWVADGECSRHCLHC